MIAIFLIIDRKSGRAIDHCPHCIERRQRITSSCAHEIGNINYTIICTIYCAWKFLPPCLLAINIVMIPPPPPHCDHFSGSPFLVRLRPFLHSPWGTEPLTLSKEACVSGRRRLLGVEGIDAVEREDDAAPGRQKGIIATLYNPMQVWSC
jgi:hypothetical protein